VIERDVASNPAPSLPATVEEIARPTASSSPAERTQWEAGHELAWHRAETERVRVLVEFLSRPIHAYGGAEPDPDIISAYNLAVESALQGIRRATADRG
jgi:hypothetical protein